MLPTSCIYHVNISLNMLECSALLDCEYRRKFDFKAFENKIRGLINPEGIHSPQSKGTIDLVTDKTNQKAEVVEDLRHDLDEKK